MILCELLLNAYMENKFIISNVNEDVFFGAYSRPVVGYILQ